MTSSAAVASTDIANDGARGQRRIPYQQRQHRRGDSAGSAGARPPGRRARRARSPPSAPPAARSATDARPPRTSTSTTAPTSAHEPGPHPGPAQHQQRGADHDRAVRAADRDEVGQPGEPEPLGKHRVEVAGVAVDQPGQQPALLVGQHRRRRGAARRGPRRRRAATTAAGRATPAVAARGRASPTARCRSRSGCSAPVAPDALAGQHVPPPGRVAEDEHRPSTGPAAGTLP